VLVGTSAGVLFSLDPRSGRVRWRWRTGAAVVAAAAADEARIYVLAYDHILRALDRRTGNLRWRRALPHRPAGAPLVVGGTVIVPSFSTELAGYDAEKGTPIDGERERSGRFDTVPRGGRVTGTRITAAPTDGQSSPSGRASNRLSNHWPRCRARRARSRHCRLRRCAAPRGEPHGDERGQAEELRPGCASSTRPPARAARRVPRTARTR
jgi:hypothetical protein